MEVVQTLIRTPGSTTDGNARGPEALFAVFDAPFEPSVSSTGATAVEYESGIAAIAVLSDAYLKAAMPAPEWAAAFARDPTGVQRKLVPVRVDLCEPGGLLGQVVYIDLCGLSETEAAGRLLAGIGGRVKPAAPPPFPGA